MLLQEQRGRVEVPSSAVTGYEAAVGDPTVSLSVTAWERGGTAVGVSASAKLPLTDTTQFGTGEWDVGGAVSFSHGIGPRTLLGLDVSYWHLGDLPELDLRDPVMGAASVGYLVGHGWAVSASFSAARSIVPGFEDSYSAAAGLTRLGSRGALSVNASIGLSETAADFALGVNWRVRVVGG